MPAPQRQDYDTVIRELQEKVERLERAARNPTIFLPNSTVVPPDPVAGGLFYVSGGALHYVGPSSTDTTVAPA